MDKPCGEKDVVLVIDDEEMVVEMIGELIKEFGCAYESFDDPRKALRYYEENPQKITLMITDVTMPDLSGPELIREAMKINPALPVILVTAYPYQQVPADMASLVRRVIPKPFTKAELLETVRAALSNADAA